MNNNKSGTPCHILLRRSIFMASAAFILPSAVSAAAAEAEDAAEMAEMEEIVIMGSRLPADLSSMPGSFQILNAVDIDKYTTISSDIGQLLEQAVPGMAPNQGDASNFTNVVRGREPSYLIDGFPQTLPLRGGGRDMRIIDPSAIERIEIIRGSTALYGQGGAGGYINYITKRPGKDEWKLSSEVGLGIGLTRLDTDGFTYQIRQNVMGGMDRWDVLLSGFYEKIGVMYDGEGDAIPPDPFQQGGVSEADTKSLLAKLGFDLSEEQRFEATVNYYKKAQDTDFVAGRMGSVPLVKAPRVPKNSPDATFFGNGPIDPFTRNVFAALNYLHQDILGSAVRIQAMYQDYDGSFPFNPRYFPAGDSAAIVGEKYSVRLDLNTPIGLGENGYILWGGEWTQDTTGQEGVETGALIMPKVTLDSYAAFAQIHLNPVSWLSLNGGIRYEDATLDVPDYQTVRQFINPFDPNAGFRSDNLPVSGGKLYYDELLFNVGAVVDVTESTALFAAFSQGFVVSDVGRVLRNFSGGSIFDRIAEVQPQITDSYEVGVRATLGKFSGSVAVYYNESSLGSSYDPISLELVRAPERVWGVEIMTDVNLDDVRFGGTLGWANSEVDENDDGVFESRLNYWRVPPVKLTTYLEYDFSPEWMLRLQGLKIFSENRFPEVAPFTRSAQSPIEGYFVLDMSVSGKTGPGILSLGIKNVLNNKYFSVVAQTSTNSRPETYTMAQGAAALLKYRIEY